VGDAPESGDKKMFKIKVTAAVITLAGVGLMALPAGAQYAIIGEQPVVGTLHQTEASLDQQLTRDYQLGLIDPFQLSKMTRDLDAIRCHEEAYRMRSQGMTPKNEVRIQNQLALFQANLNRACRVNADNVRVVYNY
jgi:hypothetical protein